MVLAVFKSDLTAEDKRQVVEVRQDWTGAIRAERANIVEHPNREAVELSRVALYRGSKRIFGTVGHIHPWIKGVTHPSILEGQNILIGRLCLGDINPVPEIGGELLDGSPTSFGGPVATAVARLIFGIDGARRPF